MGQVLGRCGSTRWLRAPSAGSSGNQAVFGESGLLRRRRRRRNTPDSMAEGFLEQPDVRVLGECVKVRARCCWCRRRQDGSKAKASAAAEAATGGPAVVESVMFSIQSAGNRGIIIGADRIDEQLQQHSQSAKKGRQAGVRRGAGLSTDSHHQKQPPSVRKRLQKLINRHILRKQPEDASSTGNDSEQEEPDYQPSRYKPESLDILCQRTKFSRKELQLMYRGFKQECPAGIVNEEMFTDIYAQFFPQGDSSSYARYVFNAFDKDRSGSISFEEFVVTLSTLCRGTLEDKLRWAFALYDVNGDGVITHDEMVQVVASIYEMMGSYTDPTINDATVYQHVDSIYTKVGSAAGTHQAMTWEQFYDLCQRDERVLMSIAVFDTVM